MPGKLERRRSCPYIPSRRRLYEMNDINAGTRKPSRMFEVYADSVKDRWKRLGSGDVRSANRPIVERRAYGPQRGRNR